MKALTQIFVHSILSIFVLFLLSPLYFAIVAASHDGASIMKNELIRPGNLLVDNLKTVLITGIEAIDGEPVWHLLVNSLCMALVIALGKIVLALMSAFALVYFELPFKKILFAIIFSTMMLPVEVRIVPTFQVIASLGWVNKFSGLTVPLMASATATFLFRQFFKTLPNELVEAAKLDGAGPWRFFWDILLPLSKTPIAALFIILFVFGWNQYLWPLIITNDPDKSTLVMGIRYLTGVADQAPQWHYIMCVALLALLPPCLLILIMQKQFEKGLTH